MSDFVCACAIWYRRFFFGKIVDSFVEGRNNRDNDSAFEYKN